VSTSLCFGLSNSAPYMFKLRGSLNITAGGGVGISTWTPITGLGLGMAEGVACAPSNFCMAYSESEYAFWNGTKWSSAHPGSYGPVSCASSALCIAISTGTQSGGTYEVSAIWNGTAWSLENVGSVPISASETDRLSAISCPTIELCVAVGSFATGYANGIHGEADYRPLIWLWHSGASTTALGSVGTLPVILLALALLILIAVAVVGVRLLRGTTIDNRSTEREPILVSRDTVNAVGNQGRRHARKRRLLPRWRKATWALVVFNVLILLWLVTGIMAVGQQSCNGLSQNLCNGAKEVGGGIGVLLILFLWFIGFMVLGLIWIMSRPVRRLCPTCGAAVSRGQSRCESCGYNYAEPRISDMAPTASTRSKAEVSVSTAGPIPIPASDTLRGEATGGKSRPRSLAERLGELNELRDSGLITETEFAQRRVDLLDQI
jgi:hypothetical protein